MIHPQDFHHRISSKACSFYPVSVTAGFCAAWLITSGDKCACERSRGINKYNVDDRERMSPLQASVVNTCLIDSDRDRKGALNSCQCFGVSGTAVDLQGRSGQPSRMERCFGLFGLGGFESKGKYDTKSKRRALSHTFGELN